MRFFFLVMKPLVPSGGPLVVLGLYVANSRQYPERIIESMV
jgi:hypothetical protein